MTFQTDAEKYSSYPCYCISVIITDINNSVTSSPLFTSCDNFWNITHNILFIQRLSENKLLSPDAHPEFFTGGWRGGVDPETIYNLRFILKIML
jgi:hypothetical protein